jgi:hypothetical protein
MDCALGSEGTNDNVVGFSGLQVVIKWTPLLLEWENVIEYRNNYKNVWSNQITEITEINVIQIGR